MLLTCGESDLFRVVTHTELRRTPHTGHVSAQTASATMFPAIYTTTFRRQCGHVSARRGAGDSSLAGLRREAVRPGLALLDAGLTARRGISRQCPLRCSEAFHSLNGFQEGLDLRVLHILIHPPCLAPRQAQTHRRM
mgnify:CR=1 FL=1